MQVHSIHDLFILELQQMYSVEQRLIKELPAMAKLAFEPALKEALEVHIAQTVHQKENLDKIFSELKLVPVNRDARAIEGLVVDTIKVYDLVRPDNIKDISLAFSAQKIEQYEITSYTKLLELLTHFDDNEAETLLRENLHEEIGLNNRLLSIGDIELRKNIGGRDRT